ncbi:MAG: Bcr/CflA family multidrug efflux MFS transporter [Bradyrhizobiaceae bacterium]|nr:Bcr/CflA family multidrug efflux MFS transporter [Bradyrhizobiaceae bacterium]
MPNRTRLIFILGALIAFGPLSHDMYLPSLPAIARELDATIAGAQATLSAFMFGLAANQLVVGPISDRAGRRRPLLVGLAIYCLTSIACALAPNIESLWAARLVQSIGACAAIVIARAIVRDLYRGAEAAHFLSMLMLVFGVAPVVGPPLGAFILEQSSWRGIFWFLTGFSLLVFIVVWRALPETLPPERRSATGIAGALGSYFMLLGDRRFLAPTLAVDAIYAGLFAFILAGPFVFIELYGLTPQQFGIAFSVNAVGLMMATQVNARLVRRYGPARMLTASIIVYFFGAAMLMISVLTGFGGLAGILVSIFICFSTLGAAPNNALALATEPFPHAAGSASALFGSIQFGVGALVGVIVGFIHDGTALPMAAIFLAAAIGALIVNFALMPRAQPAV